MQKIDEVFKSLNYRLTEEEFKETLNFFSDERFEVRKMIEMLSWNENEEVQHKAIDFLVNNLIPCEYVYLILPDEYTVVNVNGNELYYKKGTNKSRWENAAKVVVKLGWPKVDNITIPLFMWLIDSNWPGSQLIYDFILTLPKNIFELKIKEILDNPQNYTISDYEDLELLIEDLREDRTEQSGYGSLSSDESTNYQSGDEKTEDGSLSSEELS